MTSMVPLEPVVTYTEKDPSLWNGRHLDRHTLSSVEYGFILLLV